MIRQSYYQEFKLGIKAQEALADYGKRGESFKAHFDKRIAESQENTTESIQQELLEFLVDCVRLEDEENHIWIKESEEDFLKYYNKHSKNFESIIECIDKKIEEIEEEFYGKKWWQSSKYQYQYLRN